MENIEQNQPQNIVQQQAQYPAPQQSEIPPAPQKQNLNIKWILFALIAILLVAGASSEAFYLINKSNKEAIISRNINPTDKPTPTPTPTPDPNANWQTFNDPKGIFSIKFPKTWTIGNGGSDNSYTVTDTDFSTIFKDVASKSPYDHYLFIIRYLNSEIPNAIPSSYRPINNDAKAIQINSYTGLRGSITSSFEGIGEAVFIKDPNGGHLEITKEVGGELFDQVLSTIKFMK